MGREKESKGLAPPAIRKDGRAKQARQIVNRIMPTILATNTRARRGVEASELIVDPPQVFQRGPSVESVGARPDEVGFVKRKGQGRRKARQLGTESKDDPEGGNRGTKERRRGQDSIEDIGALSITTMSSPLQSSATPIAIPPPKIRIINTDTLTAAHMLTCPSDCTKEASRNPLKPNQKQPNVLILNMASSLRPGGGVLNGATSQEEFLCSRTTLLPSLKETFYRLPEYGGIYTPDVLVFRNSLPLSDADGDLGHGQRFWIDVVSAGMVRFSDLEGDEDEEKRLAAGDRKIVESKMRAVLRIAEMKGSKKIVIGAWGCGAYGNPVPDIAHAWRKVLIPDRPTTSRRSERAASELETWASLEEVVIAISNAHMAREFADAFSPEMEVESGPITIEEEAEEEKDQLAEEIRTKIRELEGQLSKVWNPGLKDRIGDILEGLKAQLRETEGSYGEETDCEQSSIDEHGVEQGEDQESEPDEEEYTGDEEDNNGK